MKLPVWKKLLFAAAASAAVMASVDTTGAAGRNG
jgi:hypothetical protein